MGYRQSGIPVGPDERNNFVYDQQPPYPLPVGIPPYDEPLMVYPGLRPTPEPPSTPVPPFTPKPPVPISTPTPPASTVLAPLRTKFPTHTPFPTFTPPPPPVRGVEPKTWTYRSGFNERLCLYGSPAVINTSDRPGSVYPTPDRPGGGYEYSDVAVSRGYLETSSCLSWEALIYDEEDSWRASGSGGGKWYDRQDEASIPNVVELLRLERSGPPADFDCSITETKESERPTVTPDVTPTLSPLGVLGGTAVPVVGKPPADASDNRHAKKHDWTTGPIFPNAPPFPTPTNSAPTSTPHPTPRNLSTPVVPGLEPWRRAFLPLDVPTFAEAMARTRLHLPEYVSYPSRAQFGSVGRNVGLTVRAADVPYERPEGCNENLSVFDIEATGGFDPAYDDFGNLMYSSGVPVGTQLDYWIRYWPFGSGGPHERLNTAGPRSSGPTLPGMDIPDTPSWLVPLPTPRPTSTPLPTRTPSVPYTPDPTPTATPTPTPTPRPRGPSVGQPVPPAAGSPTFEFPPRLTGLRAGGNRFIPFRPLVENVPVLAPATGTVMGVERVDLGDYLGYVAFQVAVRNPDYIESYYPELSPAPVADYVDHQWEPYIFSEVVWVNVGASQHPDCLIASPDVLPAGQRTPLQTRVPRPELYIPEGDTVPGQFVANPPRPQPLVTSTPVFPTPTLIPTVTPGGPPTPVPTVAPTHSRWQPTLTPLPTPHTSLTPTPSPWSQSDRPFISGPRVEWVPCDAASRPPDYPFPGRCTKSWQDVYVLRFPSLYSRPPDGPAVTGTTRNLHYMLFQHTGLWPNTVPQRAGPLPSGDLAQNRDLGAWLPVEPVGASDSSNPTTVHPVSGAVLPWAATGGFYLSPVCPPKNHGGVLNPDYNSACSPFPIPPATVLLPDVITIDPETSLPVRVRPSDSVPPDEDLLTFYGRQFCSDDVGRTVLCEMSWYNVLVKYGQDPHDPHEVQGDVSGVYQFYSGVRPTSLDISGP